MSGNIAIVAGGLLAGSFMMSLVLTAVVRYAAEKRGFVARPTVDRYHQRIVALGGGIGIFGTIFIMMLAAAAAVKVGSAGGRLDFLGPDITVHIAGFLGKINQILILAGCLATLFTLGFVDDVRHLGPKFKLAVQFAVAIAAAAFADVRVEFFIHNKIITTLLSAVWMVFLMNSLNFLDNMDGLCAGIAAICASVLFAAAALSGQMFVGGMALVYIGALGGFLFFNFPPAKIFMGDCGSLVVGFMLGVISLKTTYYNAATSQNMYSVFMPLIVMSVPMYDFLSVTFLRIRQGKSPFVGDTQHFSHRLKRRGLSDRQTALTLYLATLCTSLGAVMLYRANLAGVIMVFAQTVMILSIIAILEGARPDEQKG